MTLTVPREMATVLNGVLARNAEIWLIGSRANGTAKDTSDWDFVIFGGRDVLAELQRITPVPSLDLLVILDPHTYMSPWPRRETGQLKQGTWSLWKWQKLSEDEATYEATKLGHRTSRKRARRVQRCESTA